MLLTDVLVWWWQVLRPCFAVSVVDESVSYFGVSEIVVVVVVKLSPGLLLFTDGLVVGVTVHMLLVWCFTLVVNGGGSFCHCCRTRCVRTVAGFVVNKIVATTVRCALGLHQKNWLHDQPRRSPGCCCRYSLSLCFFVGDDEHRSRSYRTACSAVS